MHCEPCVPSRMPMITLFLEVFLPPGLCKAHRMKSVRNLGTPGDSSLAKTDQSTRWKARALSNIYISCGYNVNTKEYVGPKAGLRGHVLFPTLVKKTFQYLTESSHIPDIQIVLSGQTIESISSSSSKRSNMKFDLFILGIH